MRLLLDTHVWLWSFLDPARIPARVARELVSTENELWLSPVSVWEALVLCEKKKLELRPDPWTWVQAALLTEAPLTYAVALAVGRVRMPHRDPADRFLVATAQVYDLTLVSADAHLLHLPDLKVLPAR